MKKPTAKDQTRSIFNYLLARDTLFATLSVFLVMGLLALIPINTHVLDPFKLALHDFNYNDLAYAKMEKNKGFAADTNIVIVNIGDAGRPEIAAMIEKVMQAGPKVAGVDVLFDKPKTAQTDSLLRDQFKKYPNLVMAYSMAKLDEPKGYFYNTTGHKGFANFIGEEAGVIRYVKPVISQKGLHFDSFAAAIVKVADPKAYQHLENSANSFEIINYRRTADKFLVLQGQNVLNNEVDAATFKNKIVLLGYVSKNETDIEDRHFTPLNESFTGRGIPDMNGIFIHSNIIGMALDNQLIGQTPSWLNWLIALLIGYISMAFFIKYYMESHMWFHLKAKVVQIIMAVLFVYAGLWMFYKFDTQINMTATLAAVILAVDVLYFYQSFALWLNKKIKYQTIFTHETHH